MTNINESIIIESSENGTRIDAICASRFPDITRSQWTSRGTFTYENEKRLEKTKARVGQEWTIHYTEKMNFEEIIPWKTNLKILHESKTWVAVEKPENVSVHPSPSDPSQETLLNALVAHFGDNLSENKDKIDGQLISRPGLVHRLDKGTSGVILVAKNNATHSFLQSHWKSVEKIYYAIVSGRPPKNGKIEAPIMRDPSNRKKMIAATGEKSKEAVTYFEREKTINHPQWGEISLLRIKIPTGRTHQIRVHLSSIGFPIIGDISYKGEYSARIILHAFQITLPDPDTKKQITVESPLPRCFFVFD